MTEEGTLDNCLIARLTPTRSSPFSPLRKEYNRNLAPDRELLSCWVGRKHSKPEENEGISSNKPFGTNKNTPTTLKEMPPRLP